jgi:syntaxin 1B/2/3
VQKYVRVESEYKSKTRARAERQYRIVNPQATPQEVKAAIEDDNGQQIFSQALLNSNRHGEARGALREVQTRHEELRKIEQTMTELAQLFQEIDTLIVEQGERVCCVCVSSAELTRAHSGEQIGQIENSAMVAETDMKQGCVCLLCCLCACR